MRLSYFKHAPVCGCAQSDLPALLEQPCQMSSGAHLQARCNPPQRHRCPRAQFPGSFHLPRLTLATGLQAGFAPPQAREPLRAPTAPPASLCTEPISLFRSFHKENRHRLRKGNNETCSRWNDLRLARPFKTGGVASHLLPAPCIRWSDDTGAEERSPSRVSAPHQSRLVVLSISWLGGCVIKTSHGGQHLDFLVKPCTQALLLQLPVVMGL